MSDDAKRTEERDGVLDESEMSQIVGGAGQVAKQGPTIDEESAALQEHLEPDIEIPSP